MNTGQKRTVVKMDFDVVGMDFGVVGVVGRFSGMNPYISFNPNPAKSDRAPCTQLVG